MRLPWSYPIRWCRPAGLKTSAMICNALYDNLHRFQWQREGVGASDRRQSSGQRLGERMNYESLRPTACFIPAQGNAPGLEFGHSEWVNPEGWQTVAGGRPRGWGRRPPDHGGEIIMHPGGVPDRPPPHICSPTLRIWRLPQSVSGCSGTPPGCASLKQAFRWSFPPFPRTTTGYLLATLRVGSPAGSGQEVQTPVAPCPVKSFPYFTGLQKGRGLG